MQRKLQIKRKSKILFVLLIILLVITGCKKEDNKDALMFKEEFESYNDELSKVFIDEDNPFVYTNDVYKLVNDEKAFVMFFVNPKDEKSRSMIEPIIKSSSSLGLKKVYYFYLSEGDNYEVGGVQINKVPSILAVIRKKAYKVVYNKDNVNLIIESVVEELSSCDINQGC